jgi:hypothetical protein
VKLSVIVEIRKYRRLQKGYHFILMAMEVHSTPGCDMDHFIKECVGLFHDRQSKGHLSLSFHIQFFKQHVNIVFKHVLAYVIKKVGDNCSRPCTIIKSHNLHVGDITRAMGEIISYHEKD